MKPKGPGKEESPPVVKSGRKYVGSGHVIESVAMRLFIRAVLLTAIWIPGAFAATLATATVNCVTNSSTEVKGSAASVGCSSNVGPFSYSADASAGAFKVSASAFSSNHSFLPQVGANSRFEGDFLLTLFGGTGTGFYFPTFYFPQWYPGIYETDNVDAIFNGITVYHKENGPFAPITVGVAAPFTFGQPIPLHIVMTAHVFTGGITDRGPASISLELTGFTVFDCTQGVTCSSTYLLTEAPEPAMFAPVLTALLWFTYRRSRFGEESSIGHTLR